MNGEGERRKNWHWNAARIGPWGSGIGERLGGLGHPLSQNGTLSSPWIKNGGWWAFIKHFQSINPLVRALCKWILATPAPSSFGVKGDRVICDKLRWSSTLGAWWGHLRCHMSVCGISARDEMMIVIRPILFRWWSRWQNIFESKSVEHWLYTLINRWISLELKERINTSFPSLAYTKSVLRIEFALWWWWWWAG